MVWRLLLVVFSLMTYCQTVWAEGEQHSLLSDVSYFHEDPNSPLSLQEVQQRFQSGQVQHPKQNFLSLGISKQATWIRLEVQNTTGEPQFQRLNAAQPWVDHLSVYLMNDSGLLKEWHSGDSLVADSHLLAGVGFVFDMTIPPGKSDILIRGQSLDPLTLPIALLDSYQSRTLDSQIHVTSGIVYGVLLALVGFNLVLYSSLKQLDALLYSIYISCFIIVNLSYNGYGFAWFYPNSLFIANHLTLIFMVFHGVSGLVFVSNFLEIRTRTPKLHLGLNIYNALGIIAMVVLISLQQHLLATTLAFKFLSLTTVIMIFLGIWNLGKTKDAWYFLGAVACSMLGLLITTLSVWGMLPYNYYSYNGAVFGVVFEAIILAVIVAYRLKDVEQKRATAEYLAAYDPLTNLFNRRSLMSAGTKLIHFADQSKKPLSFVMMDIDHFKTVNDTYGHQVGDQALIHIANLLRSNTRATDTLSRWGGEEMVILLPNTNASQALAYTEHLRLTIAQTPLIHEGQEIKLTASFGIATRKKFETLDELYQRADKQLYLAKRQGRNRVEPAFEK